MTTTEDYLNRGYWLPGGVLLAGQVVPITRPGPPVASIMFSSVDEVRIVRRGNPTASDPDEVMVEGVHYTVAKDSSEEISGITITTLVATVAAEEWLWHRVTPTTQQTDYTPAGKFPAKSHEEALDKLTRQVADLQNRVDLAIRAPHVDTARNLEAANFELEINTARANSILGFDSDGVPSLTGSEHLIIGEAGAPAWEATYAAPAAGAHTLRIWKIGDSCFMTGGYRSIGPPTFKYVFEFPVEYRPIDDGKHPFLGYFYDQFTYVPTPYVCWIDQIGFEGIHDGSFVPYVEAFALYHWKAAP